METAQLKNFAAKARTTLLAEINARIGVVLAPYSDERNEVPGVVAQLEKAITAEGGGEKGRAAVADKVAYTWFNRIIALRFMDANGYTGIGVVSPQPGREGGQPEILAEAKLGRIDREVVSDRAAKAVMKLLNQERRSKDPQGEAYGLLLAEYCHYWHRAMPFMFEREGDYTELLIPGRLLAGNSVMSRAVAVLTEEVCKDVEVIGWLYQFYISERKDEVFKGFKKNKKAGAAEIPAATQLFTPNWIVRYLVQNSLGCLWLLNQPASMLAEQMEYYIEPVDEETDFLKIDSPEELKLIDPACGSGHMLTYAFDLLYAIYEEEGYTPSEIPALILANNLYGTEIDPRAGALAAFALAMKARSKQRTFFNKEKVVEPNICVLKPISFTPAELDLLVTSNGDREAEIAFWNQFQHADTFGSLIQPDAQLIKPITQALSRFSTDGEIFRTLLKERADQVIIQSEFLSCRYNALATNPPYMDARNMGARLDEFVSVNFPKSSSGIDLAFTVRSRLLVRTGGYISLLTMDSWLGNVECQGFREFTRENLALKSLLHLGKRAFPEINGEVVQVVASTFSTRTDIKGKSVFIDTTEGLTTDEKMERFSNLDYRYTHALNWFDIFPSAVLTPYSASDHFRDLFESTPPMSKIAEVRTGLQTGDNEAFLRYWYEVSNSRIRTASARDQSKWVPYVKSSTPTRWFAREEFVVNWEMDGSLIRNHPSAVSRNIGYYFRPGISYGGLAENLKGRLVNEGSIFDQKNSMIFPRSDVSAYALLALINSSALEKIARYLSPKGFGVGILGKLPIPEEVLDNHIIEELAEVAVGHSRCLYDSQETSSGYTGLQSLMLGKERCSQLEDSYNSVASRESHLTTRLVEIQHKNNEYFMRSLLSSGDVEAQIDQIPPIITQKSFSTALVSLIVGCIFGRYSLDQQGLILANHGDTIQDYLAKVPTPSFMPDKDNVIPIVDGDWFEDDIVGRVREFLRVAFGEQHFEENLWFVTEALGVKDLRSYFLKFFYQDHWKRYKKRPIYWMFSSPNGSFNALIYMHRYTPSTVSTVLEYLRQYQAKLEANRQHHENLSFTASTTREKAKAQKEAERLRKILVELVEYEDKVLYPLATEQIHIDLDDGVKANYPKFGAALKKIPGLEAKHE